MEQEIKEKDTVLLEEKHLKVVRWRDSACYSMNKPLVIPAEFVVFVMDNRAPEIGVIKRNRTIKMMSAEARAKELMKKDVMILENGMLYGKRKVLAALLSKINPAQTFESEHIKRVKRLYELNVLSVEQAFARLLPYMNKDQASLYLRAD